VGAGLRSSQHAPRYPRWTRKCSVFTQTDALPSVPRGRMRQEKEPSRCLRRSQGPTEKEKGSGQRWTGGTGLKGGGGRGPRAPTYAQAAGPAPRPPQSSPPAPILTPLAGHAASTTQDSFWIQWIFPAIDDGKVSCDEVKKQLRKNEVTRFLTPGKSEFQYANRALLSKEYLGGWYVAFPVRRGPAGQSERDAYTRYGRKASRSSGRWSSHGERTQPKQARYAPCAASSGTTLGDASIARRNVPSAQESTGGETTNASSQVANT
jgi:hypothetical protein